jgi:hypothetical protein
LAEGEKAHPANYRGCRHAKEELQKRKSQRTPKTTTGRVFSSILTTPGISFAAALRGSTAQQQKPQERQIPVADPSSAGRPNVPSPEQQQETGQSVRVAIVNSQPLDSMVRVVTAVQQTMTEFNGAVSDKDKIVAITTIVLNLMNQNGH